MDAARDLRHAPGAASLRDWWLRHGDRLLLLAIISMVTLASLKLGAEAYRSVLGQQPADAVDLLARQSETRLWFSAQAVYVKPGHQTYPPASFAMLWPMVGWLPPAELRWVWVISGLLALIWLARLAVRESGASSRFERLFMGALPFAMTSTATTIGQGQLLVHLLPLAIAGLLLLWRGPASLRCDLLGAGLLLLALIKPTATVPFAVLALFAPGRLRPAALIAVGYLALTRAPGSRSRCPRSSNPGGSPAAACARPSPVASS
jgi:hypothetical protein